MSKFGVGQPVRRVEDQRLITGQGRYTDDINLPGQAHGYVLRSPTAHARITRLDTSAAKAAPGVLLVLTGAELDAAIPCLIPIKNRDVIYASRHPSVDFSKFLNFIAQPVGIANSGFAIADNINGN